MSSCDLFWDGVDFTPCFRRRLIHSYLSAFPLLLVALSAASLAVAAVSRRRHGAARPVTASRLVSPTADTNLTRLEADLVVSALAGNVLDGKPVPPADAEGVIRDFSATSTPGLKRWDTLRWVVRVVGAVAYLGVEAASVIDQRTPALLSPFVALVFPTWMLVIAPFPKIPIQLLLTAHLVSSVLMFRSTVVQPGPTPLIALAPALVELVWWAAVVSVPYASNLSGVLRDAVSKGGCKFDPHGKPVPGHIEEPTSSFSRGTYAFILPLLWKHYWKPMTLEDVPAIREDDAAAAIVGSFREHLARRDAAHHDQHGTKRVRNLAWDLMTFFTRDVCIQCTWITVFIVLAYLPPVGLRLLLQYVGDREVSPQPPHMAVLYVAMMAIGQSTGVVALGQALVLGRRVCVRMRAIIISEAFAKALRRQDIAGGASDGKIANIVSTDAFTISEICAYIFYLWSSPLAIVVNTVLLYQTLGVASFVGIAILVIMVPVQTFIGKLYTLFQRRLLAATDARLDAVTEVISHIKLIKFNAWELKFLERMSATRARELSALAQRFSLSVVQNALIWGTPVIVTAGAFAIHVLVFKQPLTADRAFSSLVLFNMLRDPLALAQDTITRLLQAYTSCVRIQSFLDEPDTPKYDQLSVPGPGDPQIGFRDAVLGYPETATEAAKEDTVKGDVFKLGPIDVAFPLGQLSIITGPVGCGKTTLILSLLGETSLLSGQIFMPDDHANRQLCPAGADGLRDSVAFCAQTSWLVGASIKDNILFGSAWDAQRYHAVVDACALRRDFEIFDLGDETEVGEKGTTCSGGQKARIALARAVYSDARIVILDDVLSAVDAQTARHIYNQVLRGPLMRHRTCILVTHAVSLVLPAAAYVVSLDSGRLVGAGTPAELVAAGLLEHADEDKGSSDVAASRADASSSTSASTTVAADSPDGAAHDIIEEVLGDDAALEAAKKQHDADLAAPEAARLAKQLVQTETSKEGATALQTYMLYFRSMGGLVYWCFLVMAIAGAQLLQVANNAWLKDWSNATRRAAEMRAAVMQEKSTQFYLGVYCAISGLYILGVAARVGVSYFGSLHASRALYDRLLRRILGAKMRFFDSTPSGRIINRLSKDMSGIDSEATEILSYFAFTVLSCFAILAVVVFSTPAFLFSLVLIMLMYYIVGTLYVTTSRELKRLDSVTRSPILVSFSEVLVGMSTIRSYADSARFTQKLMRELDANTRCFWYLWQSNRVLNNFSNFVGTLVTISACALALNSPGMSAGAVGFSITYALSFTDFVLWVVRLYAMCEMSMNSVERIAEYLDLEVEEEDFAKGIEPPAYWPSREGAVVVENLVCKYAPQLDPVLNNVSFRIEPREKIGICGRTGSGKSTLALSFFRLLHQEGGRILIDGLDISKISLATLRSRLTILPQEAQLFSGTVRDNLDPFGQHEDFEVWEALRQCGLASKTPGPSRAASRAVSRAPSIEDGVAGAPDDDADEVVEERIMIRSLDETVAVGGKNFSQGQRQLLALARGLLKLRSSSFLIMDESTANLDHATDATIQNVLRTGLADTQMLVIAHRLMTVCGLDKILVLDHGKVVEFGTPYELMMADGSFRDLCRQSGEEAQLIESVHESKQ